MMLVHFVATHATLVMTLHLVVVTIAFVVPDIASLRPGSMVFALPDIPAALLLVVVDATGIAPDITIITPDMMRVLFHGLLREAQTRG